MAFGLGRLRLAPAAFWSMTPRELAAAVDGATERTRGPAPLTRGGLARLEARFPDPARCRREPERGA